MFIPTRTAAMRKSAADFIIDATHHQLHNTELPKLRVPARFAINGLMNASTKAPISAMVGVHLPGMPQMFGAVIRRNRHLVRGRNSLEVLASLKKPKGRDMQLYRKLIESPRIDGSIIFADKVVDGLIIREFSFKCQQAFTRTRLLKGFEVVYKAIDNHQSLLNLAEYIAR
jgi:hypothetical protein